MAERGAAGGVDHPQYRVLSTDPRHRRQPVQQLGAGLAETWHTLDYLIEEGCLYIADWVNDDQPYLMNVGGKRLVSIPYSYEINDSPFIQTRAGHVDDFVAAIKHQFDVLYAEGA